MSIHNIKKKLFRQRNNKLQISLAYKFFLKMTGPPNESLFYNEFVKSLGNDRM